MENKTVLITGSSTGIGKAAAKYFQEKGWNVAATMRKPEEHQDLADLENVNCYKLDVTDNATIKDAINQAINDFGKVDVVVNNAGYGLLGAFELATEEQIRKQFDTNLFGLMNVTREVLPHFRQNRSGVFINVSSIGGLITFPCISLYHSTKWAVEGFSESLSYELGELGIKVRIIEPGAIKTDFSTRSLDWVSKEGISDYDEVTQKIQTAMETMTDPETISPAEKVGEVIFEAATDESDRIRYLVGEDAEGMWKSRQEQGDVGFVSATREQFLS